MKDLNEIRKEIDRIDNEMVELFSQRMDISKSVGEYKKENNLPVLDEKREQIVIEKAEKRGGEYGSAVKLMYQNIMELSRAVQYNIVGGDEKLRCLIENASSLPDGKDISVAFQGIKGSNSNEAAERLFPTGQLKALPSFEDVFDAVDKGNCLFGVLPVENSTAGSVSAVYDLILRYRFYIVGALSLPIDYCLAGLRQSELEDIEIVVSHPQALSQCENYTQKHGFKPQLSSNTAVAARDTANEKRLNLAAICPYKAAKEYGLKILDDHLQDNPHNKTRFVVISKELFISETANKVSLCFSLPHVTGSLYSLLCRFNSLGLNLSKIESRPIIGKDFEYLFYLDFSGNVKGGGVTELLCSLSEEMPEFSFLGNYFEN